MAKTTLLEQLIPQLVSRGLRLGVLKHAHHDFDIDQPGKDSHRLRKAGASQMMVASRRRHARIVETDLGEADFRELLASFDQRSLDLLLVEGFKHEHFPKIELHRAAIGKPLLFPLDRDIIAVASDQPTETALPRSTSMIWTPSPTSSAPTWRRAGSKSRHRGPVSCRSRGRARPFLTH